MSPISTGVIIASGGDLSMTPGIPISFTVTWGEQHQLVPLEPHLAGRSGRG